MQNDNQIKRGDSTIRKTIAWRILSVAVVGAFTLPSCLDQPNSIESKESTAKANQAITDEELTALIDAKRAKVGDLGGAIGGCYPWGGQSGIKVGLYANASIIASEYYGAVVIPSGFTCKLQGGANLDQILGLPTTDVESTADGTCSWVMFEHGAMTKGAGGIEPIRSEIDTRFAYSQKVLGCALSAEAVDGVLGGKLQAFDNGTVVWRADLGGYILTGKALERWTLEGSFSSTLGYPTSDTSKVVNRVVKVGLLLLPDTSAITSRFEKGTLYYSDFTGGAHKLSSTFAAAYERDFGGPNGWLGMPTSDELYTKTSLQPFAYFENGMLVFDPVTGKATAYGGLDLYVDRFDTWGSDCAGGICGSQDAYWYIKITNSSGKEIFNKRWGNGDNSSWNVQEHYDIGDANPDDVLTLRFHAKDKDDTSGDDDLGTGYWDFSMANLWRKFESVEYRVSKALAVLSVGSTGVPYDDSKYKSSKWWSYGNFETNKLSYDQFAQAFTDVNMDEWWVRHPFNAIFYEIWKGVAKKGNCYGMSLESHFAEQGRSVYREPIFEYFPDTKEHGTKLTEAIHASDPDHQSMVNEIGIKHGYQLGRNQVLFTAAAFLTGMTHEPEANFWIGDALEVAGEGSLVMLTNYLLWDGAHTVRPIEYETFASGCSWFSPTCHRIHIADPNKPFGSNPEENFIEVDPVQNAYRYDSWGGTMFTGGRLYVSPSRLVTTPQVTPFEDILGLLDDGLVLIAGAEGAVHQISDDAGRTMFQPGLSGIPSKWSEIQQVESKRVPNLAPIPIATDGAMDFQLYAGKGIKNTSHTYDLGLKSGAVTGTKYSAMVTTGKTSSFFGIPGTEGKPEHIRALNIGAEGPAFEVETPNDTNTKTIDWGISGAHKTRWTKFSDLTMTPGQRIRMSPKHGGYKVVIENFGPDTSANVTVNGGPTTTPVGIGMVEIPSGTSVIDFQMPKTTISLSNETFGNDGWHIAPVTIALSSVEYTGLGLDFIEYSVDGTNWTKYSGPFSYDTQGVTRISYRARDKEGNLEFAQSQILLIDTQTPTSTGIISTTSGVQLTYSALDPTPGSGTAGVHVLVQAPSGKFSETYYSLPNGVVSLPTKCSEIEFWAEDIAGNKQTPHAVVPDSIAPVFTNVPEVVTTHCTLSSGLNLTAIATDDCGVISLTNNAPAKLPLGTTLVTWTAIDARGNTSTAVQKITADLGDDPSCCPNGSNIIMGTSSTDNLTGTDGNDCIIALGAQDTIHGKGGNDALSGGEGNDEIWSGSGDDWAFGGTGQDRIYGEDGSDQIFGDDGADICYGGAGNDTLSGRQGPDYLYGDAGNDSLYGGIDDDHLFGGTGTNYMNGGANHDWYVTTGTGDQCTQDGEDTVSSGICTMVAP